MAEYLTPIDIANRACDHCGVPRIVTFTDNVKAAAATRSVYDQLRTAELRRNVWRFSIRKTALRAVDTTTMLLVPDAYSAAETYLQDSIVSYNNTIYFAAQAVPVATAPGAPNEAYWTVYFGPVTVSPYDSTISYYAGELVYYVGDVMVNTYQCLVTGTQANPLDATANWDSTTTYNNGDTVTYGGDVWQSIVDLNINNIPDVNALWGSVPAGQGSIQAGQDWLQISAEVRYQRIAYPIGSGPSRQTTTRNIYRLPSGYLRKAPQDPKAGAISYLGTPGGLPSDDWEHEGNYITTSDSEVIVLRFAADIQDVTLMDPMFCEGLGARIGLEICEPLTQSDSKLSTISQIYKTMMGDARAINSIETGPVEPPLDDYLAARL